MQEYLFLSVAVALAVAVVSAAVLPSKWQWKWQSQFVRQTVGRLASSRSPVGCPVLEKVEGVACDALFVRWRFPKVGASDAWKLLRVEVQTSLMSDTKWTTHYLGDEEETLIEKLRHRQQYQVRVRTWLGRAKSDWVIWQDDKKTPLPLAVWTLTERTAAGGTTGPLTNGGEYSWSQGDNETDVVIELDKPTRRGDIAVAIKSKSLRVEIAGLGVLLEGQLSKQVNVDDSFWELRNKQTLLLTLTKEKRMINWDCVVIGHPPIELF